MNRETVLDSNHFENLPDFLASCVSKIKRDHPRFSSLQLSKKLDIPNSTFDRIAKKEVKKPSFIYALKIVEEICGDEKAQDFIKKFYPQMYKDFIEVYPGNKDVPFVAPEAEIYFQDPTNHELMIMATSNCGLTKEKTLEEFGKRGLATLEGLLAEGVLKEVEGNISIEGPVNAKQDTVQKLLVNLIRMNYDLEAFGDKEHWLSVQYESVDSEYVTPKLLEIYKNTNQEIRELLNSPKSKGNDIVWAGLAMDTLAKKANLLTNKRVLQ